jgi:hypothetical protein
MRIEAVVHGFLVVALTVWVDDIVPISTVVPENGIGDRNEKMSQLPFAVSTFNTTKTPPDSSSLRNWHDDVGDLHFSVAYFFDGYYSNGYNHFVQPPSCFKNLTESYGVYTWRLPRNSSICGAESPVVEVVAPHATQISTSPNLDAQFEAFEEASTIVLHFIVSIKDGSTSSFTCLTAFVTTIIITRDILTRNKKKSARICVNVEDRKRANNRKSFPCSPSSNQTSVRRRPTTPKSRQRGRSEIEPMYSTPIKLKTRRLSRSKTRSGA